MHILLVEDDRKFSKNLKLALEIEGYRVTVAPDGESGLAQGLKQSSDLIIMDVMLPKKDGVSVVRELRNRNVQVPIIMLTARGELADRVAGLDSGADDYLVKPFGFPELFARLRSLLRRKKTTETPSFKVHDLKIDPASREVRRGRRSCGLTPKEYQLLLYLVRNRHRIVSRQELEKLLWQKKPEGNLLDVHMRYLREKIDEDHVKKLLYTVKGVGYKISV